jgi:NADP-dependent 3-hydroxy acid dehydrogenase YdfG
MNILITGTSSGFGLLTAKTLAAKGHTVFASKRDVAGKNAAAAAELRAWAEREGKKVHIVELDVSHDASVNHAVSHILEKAEHIDVVVNNAGLLSMGLGEAFTPEQMQTLFNVNVIGVQRVNRAVLPSMRARGKGLLIHISSGIGRWVLPCMGVYCATKFALEALAEAYRYELSATGVDSVIIEPGPSPTGIIGKLVPAADTFRIAAYGDAAKLTEQLGAGFGAMLSGPNAPSPQLVADAIQKLIETPVGQRPLRTIVDPLTGQITEAINAAARPVQEGLMANMGMSALLQPKV